MPFSTSSNVFNRFQNIVGRDSEDVVTITLNNGDGTSQATSLSGDAMTVKGEQVTPGNKALIRNGEVIRWVPNLTILTVNV